MKTLIRCLIAAVLLTGLLCSAAEITYRPESGSLSHVVIDGRTAYGYQHNRKPPLEDTSIPLYTRHGDYLENDSLSQTDPTLRPQIAALLQAGASADGYRLIEKHRLA